MRLSHLPLRLTTGAFILNSGLSKKGLEGQAAEGLHAMAVGAVPALERVPPQRFAGSCPTARSRSVRPCWDSPPGWSSCT